MSISVKFKNPGEQEVFVSTTDGYSARFEPGETVEVPACMKLECLAKNLTLVTETKTKTKPATKAETVEVADDSETLTVDADKQ
jgi:hypothetical protein